MKPIPSSTSITSSTLVLFSWVVDSTPATFASSMRYCGSFNPTWRRAICTIWIWALVGTGDLSSLIKWAQLEEAAALSDGLEFGYMRIEKEAGFEAGFFKH